MLRRTRRGFIGAGKLEEYSAGVVFRHEQTLSGPKADRLELLRHTQTHTGQLFFLYSDPQLRIDAILADVEASQTPVTLMTDEYGVIHRLWLITNRDQIAAIQHAMADQKLVIADGHHRYETSLNYRNECRAKAEQGGGRRALRARHDDFHQHTQRRPHRFCPRTASLTSCAIFPGAKCAAISNRGSRLKYFRYRMIRNVSKFRSVF